MPSSIITLIEKEMATFRELRLAPPNIFPDKSNLYPVPFFGDIRRAEVITLALNPAHTEFAPDRRWPIGNGVGSLTPVGLTNRLLGYFHLAQVPCHDWFTACEQGLSAIGCSYRTNAAHVDIHPLPTKFAQEMNRTYPEGIDILQKFIQATSASHMISVLALCERVKLVIVIEFSLPGMPVVRTFPFVRERLLPLAGLVDATGHEPPLLDGGSRDGIAAFLLQHQVRLRNFLHAAPPLVFSP